MRKFENNSRRFEKVSFEQFKKDLLDCFSEVDLVKMGVIPAYRNLSFDEEIRVIWDNIKLPRRATKGSAGYDFFAPFNLTFPVGKEVKFPTGIRVLMPNNNVLKLFPRSGFGFKYRFQLNNTIGVIDSDYYYSDNEGHMFAKMICDSRRLDVTKMSVKSGEAYMQGIFEEFLLTDDDEADGIRNGGFGSTDVEFGSTTDGSFGSTTEFCSKTLGELTHPIKKDRYELGDKVLIKTLEQMLAEFPKDVEGFPEVKCGIVEEMVKYFGEVVTILEYSPSGYYYYLEEDGERWNWSDDMFAGCVGE